MYITRWQPVCELLGPVSVLSSYQSFGVTCVHWSLIAKCEKTWTLFIFLCSNQLKLFWLYFSFQTSFTMTGPVARGVGEYLQVHTSRTVFFCMFPQISFQGLQVHFMTTFLHLPLKTVPHLKYTMFWHFVMRCMHKTMPLLQSCQLQHIRSQSFTQWWTCPPTTCDFMWFTLRAYN